MSSVEFAVSSVKAGVSNFEQSASLVVAPSVGDVTSMLVRCRCCWMRAAR